MCNNIPTYSLQFLFRFLGFRPVFLKKKIGDNVFLLVEKIKRGIIKGLKFWQKRADRKEKEKKLVIGILATVLTVFIFLNITCLMLVLTGYI